MRHARSALVFLALLIPASSSAVVNVPTDFIDQIVVPGLDEPTSFAFLPDGRALLTEQRTGKIRLIVNGHVAANDPVFVVPLLQALGPNDGERGLLGIAVDPDWPTRPFVYLLYTRQGDAIRLVRYLASDDVDVSNGELLSLSAPRLIFDDFPDLYPNHNGGCLRFGPDRRLYVSLGEDADPCAAADSTSQRGQILRLRVDQLPIYGGPVPRRSLITPPDNPFVASPDSNARLVFAFGLRNPFRFHFDSVLGTLYAGDVGENQFEEVDEIAPGDFCGWPWHEGNLPRDRPECPEPVGGKPWRAPLITMPHDGLHGSAIISAGAYRPVFRGSNNWPPAYYAHRADVFYAQYYTGELRRLSYGGSTWAPAPPVPGQLDPDNWGTGLLTCADFLVGPDGSLWWVAQFNENYDLVSGALHRIVYTGNPTAVPAESARPLALAEPARVRLGLYDLSGRRVRTLLEGPAPAGPGRVIWDGADDRGGRVAAGVYFARLERSGAAPITVRVLRVR